MGNNKVYRSKFFTIYSSSVGTEQFYIIASVTDKNADPVSISKEVYSRISDIIRESGIRIIQEKIFGSTGLKKDILQVR